MHSYLTLKNTAILLSALVAAAYLFIHNYDPRLGIVGNAIYGQIDLTYACSTSASPPAGAVMVTQERCGLQVRYRLLLLPLIGLLAWIAATCSALAPPPKK